MCALFAATHPERTNALVLLNTYACNRHSESAHWGLKPAEIEQFLGLVMPWGKL